MSATNTTPPRLILKLVIYFVFLVAIIVGTVSVRSPEEGFVPFGGSDVLERPDIEITESRLSMAARGGGAVKQEITGDMVKRIILFLSANLAATLLVMVPITWTYSATRFDYGPSKSFVRALLVLPICASTVVLLIQDSLALAFGLAALVAAVRFRVSLSDSIDGIYIFAAICVGLASGIGYLGVATIMALFFCMTNAVLWQIDYGQNPIDDKRQQAKRAKLERST